MSSIELAGKWQDYLNWHRRLSEMVARYPDIELFAIAEPAASMEALAANSRYFEDGAHYTEGMGQLMVSCLRDDCKPDFSLYRLDAKSLDAHLAAITAIQRQYPEQRANDYKRLLRWLKLSP